MPRKTEVLREGGGGDGRGGHSLSPGEGRLIAASAWVGGRWEDDGKMFWAER